MDERRRATRQRTFLRGRVIFDYGRKSADCMIRDMSSHGAKLVFSSAVPIADVVDLQIPAKGETFRARVRWRTEDEAGVCFPGRVQPEPENAPAGDLSSRVATLESELAAIKRQLRRLLQEQEGPSLE